MSTFDNVMSDEEDHDERIADLEKIEAETRLIALARETNEIIANIDRIDNKFCFSINIIEENIKTYNDLILGACPIQIDKWNRENLTRLDKVEKILVELERFQDVTRLQYQQKNKNPHKCPVCDGYGSKLITERTSNAPADHYRQQNPCISCDGKGIVWG